MPSEVKRLQRLKDRNASSGGSWRTSPWTRPCCRMCCQKALKPALKRSLVDEVRQACKVSVRRACDATGSTGSLDYDTGKRGEQANLKLRIKQICATRVRYGYRWVHVLLRREGWSANRIDNFSSAHKGGVEASKDMLLHVP